MGIYVNLKKCWIRKQVYIYFTLQVSNGTHANNVLYLDNKESHLVSELSTLAHSMAFQTMLQLDLKKKYIQINHYKHPFHKCHVLEEKFLCLVYFNLFLELHKIYSYQWDLWNL